MFDVFETDQKIKFGQNYILKSGHRESRNEYYGKHKLDVTLESFTVLDLEITIDPQKLVFKDL